MAKHIDCLIINSLKINLFAERDGALNKGNITPN